MMHEWHGAVVEIVLGVVRGLKAEMKVLRNEWSKKLRAKAAARR